MEPSCPVAALSGETIPWYALQTRPRHEKKVATELEEKGIRSYLPLVTSVHHWSDRRKVVQLPLFSCYVFVNAVLAPAVRVSALSSWGALGFVGPNRQAVEIPASEIEQVRKLLDSNAPFSPYAFLKIGQRVRVRGGCLDGLEGILVGWQREKRLVISIQTIERSLSMSIEGYDVEPA
jgi:transcription antitermination factor NusG